MRLLRESGKPPQQIADESGVSSDPRRENRVLREESEIMKKAAILFAEETKSRR